MIYSNRTSHCAEKFISSSLHASSHPPLYLLDVCARHAGWICPVVKYFSEQMDPGGGRRRVRERGGIHAVPLPLGERLCLGKDLSSLPPGSGAQVPAWGQKSQRHLTNCVSSISSEKDHSKFSWEVVRRALWHKEMRAFLMTEKRAPGSTTCSRIRSLPVGWLYATTTHRKMQPNKHLCMCVYVRLCIKAMMNSRLSRWWTILAGSTDWNTSSVGPGPLIWWRQRQREKERLQAPNHGSNEGSWSLSPHRCPAMLGRVATLSSPNLALVGLTSE